MSSSTVWQLLTFLWADWGDTFWTSTYVESSWSRDSLFTSETVQNVFQSFQSHLTVFSSGVRCWGSILTVGPGINSGGTWGGGFIILSVQGCVSDVNVPLELSLVFHWLLVDDLWPLPSGCCGWFCCVHRHWWCCCKGVGAELRVSTLFHKPTSTLAELYWSYSNFMMWLNKKE